MVKQTKLLEIGLFTKILALKEKKCQNLTKIDFFRFWSLFDHISSSSELKVTKFLNYQIFSSSRSV